MISKKDIRSFFTITLPTLIVMLIFVELILYWLAPVEDPFARYKKKNFINSLYIESQFKPNSRFEFEVEKRLPAMDSSVVFTTNNMGFRGDSLVIPKPKDEYRVFLIGGSTTENLFLDDTWGLERKLQKYLQDSLGQVKVYNAGKSGDASPDHLAMLVHRIAHLEADLLVLFPGINDLNRLLGDYDYLHYPTITEVEDGSLVQSAKFFLSNFQLVRRIINLSKQNEPDARTSIFLKTNYADKVKEVNQLPLREALPPIDLGIYERNIRSFVGASQILGIDLLLMTQTHTWDSKDEFLNSNHWMTAVGDLRYPSDKLALALNDLNQILINIAAEEELEILDLEKAIPKSTSYFYDDCHFNKGGVDTAAQLMATKILQQLN